MGDKAIKSNGGERERGPQARNGERETKRGSERVRESERGRGKEIEREREREREDGGATNRDERSRKEWGCPRGVRGTRKGERDAACVGMDQCVNGCCLTRTAEIIVSGPDGYSQRPVSLTKTPRFEISLGSTKIVSHPENIRNFHRTYSRL